MKKLSCKSMGVDCDFVATGENEKEIMGKMMTHAKMDHPDKWAEMEQMSDEDKKKMMMDVKMKMEDA